MLRRPSPWVWLAAAAVSVARCNCDEGGVTILEAILVVSPDAIDFGTVELTQQSVEPIRFENLEKVSLELSEVSVADDCGGCFVLIDPPSALEGYGSYDMGVRFRAVRLEVATGTVTIRTSNPNDRIHRVFLAGRGSDMRRPDVAVMPPSVDFGFVPAGGIAVGSFVVRSTGTNNLYVDRIQIDPPGAPFRITTSTPSPARPAEMPPGAQASVTLRAELPATQTGTVTARVLIHTNVLEEKNVPGAPGVVAVPLIALANRPPLAVCGEDLTVEPWSRVTLDGAASRDQDLPPDLPLRFQWTLRSKPGGSTTYLERASTPAPSFWADLSGRYEVQLVVTDGLGLESEPCTVIVEALPTNAVRIELTWDHPDSDLDLHLIREGGTFCDCGTDVHYRDCAREPNWFPATPGANPRLDIDDTTGFGPENINLDGEGPTRLIPPGTYYVRVHYYASNDEISAWPTDVSNATLRIYVFGLLAAELTRPMAEDLELWNAARIVWPAAGGGDPQVLPDTGVIQGAACGGF